MKPVDVNTSIDVNFSKENNQESPKFTFGSHVRISKHESNFAKGYVPNWSEEVFVIKKVKNTVPWIFWTCWEVLWKTVANNKSERVQSCKSDEEKRQ